MTPTKPQTYAEHLAARIAAMNGVIGNHNTALAEFENAKLVCDYASENPNEFDQSQRRQFARELLETRGALELISAEDVDWQIKKTGDDFICCNLAELEAAATRELCQLTAKMPTVKTSLTARVIEATREAFGRSGQDRVAITAERDKHEETLAWLDGLAEGAATKIAYLKNNPSLESLNDVTAALGQFEHAIATAAKP